MKVLLINGSAKKNGCTATALGEVARAIEAEGIETEIVNITSGALRDCIGCGACKKTPGKCAFGDEDGINALIEKARGCDGFVFGSPVYYAHPSGRLLSALDRLFYAGKSAFAHKPGAAVSSARRAGTTSTMDVIDKYFSISEMPIVSSTYWNMVHGNTPDEVRQDLEGLRTMRNIGRNMAWLIKCIAAGNDAGIAVPDTEQNGYTNFIR